MHPDNCIFCIKIVVYSLTQLIKTLDLRRRRPTLYREEDWCGRGKQCTGRVNSSGNGLSGLELLTGRVLNRVIQKEIGNDVVAPISCGRTYGSRQRRVQEG